ncbi:MAG: hypothetical protein ACLQUY_07180 [Ktedonobacterales bacterium]
MAGALEEGTYRSLLHDAGFVDVEVEVTRRYTIDEIAPSATTASLAWQKARTRNSMIRFAAWTVMPIPFAAVCIPAFLAIVIVTVSRSPARVEKTLILLLTTSTTNTCAHRCLTVGVSTLNHGEPPAEQGLPFRYS